MVGFSSGPAAAGGPVHTVIGAGRETAQWLVGALTLEGTLNIALQSAAAGVVGGVMYALARPWLTRFGRWRGIAFGFALLLAFGALLFDAEPDRREFRHYGTPELNVVLFAALFLIFGALVAVLTDRLDRIPAGDAGSPHRAVSALRGLFAAASYGLSGGAILVGIPLTVRAFAAIISP